MTDASSPTYDLRTPAASRGESITSQLQREILGDVVVPTAAATPDRRDALPPQTSHHNTPPSRTPTPDDADLVAIATPEALSQPLAETETTTTSHDDRRRTLSPSRALAFFNQEGLADVAPSRRDTVSPEAIRSLLHGLGDTNPRSTAIEVDATTNSLDNGVEEGYLQDVARTKEYVASSKTALRPTTKRRRSSVQPTDGSSATAEQDSFTDAFFSTKLLSRDDEDEHDDENNTMESVDDAMSNRRATLEPMDAQTMLSELRSEMMDTANDEAEAPRMTTRRTRQSPSPSPNTRSRKRRATVDPVDLMTMRDDPVIGSGAASVNANRRDTIGDGDLQVLRREFGLEVESSQSTRKRKSKSPPPPKPTDTAGKRTRFDGGASMMNVGDDSPQRSRVTPEKNKAGADSQAESLLSPIPTNRANKTPLKSCLSARKAKKNDQTTPNKSVVFGPSQGAEFNMGSPSTSMTPMPARAARARFPLEEKISPPPSDDDDETALNTSLLDEADGQSPSEDENDATSAQSQQLAVEPSVSSRTRRRYSLRGVSPLDNQANARRQRRMSTMSSSTQPQSPLVSARNRRAFEAAATAAAVAASRGTGPTKTSFMSTSQNVPSSRAAYADSSASSDEGEDMEITGDFSDHAVTAKTLHTGVRQSRLSESPRRSARVSARQDSLFADSPLSDGTVEVGTLQQLLEENAQEEEKKQEPSSEDDDDLQMTSLADLAKEGEDEEPQHKPQSVSNHAASQDKNLLPIAEGEDEDRRSSSAHSMMSLDSDEESDQEYEEKRKSLVVNLSSKFERFGSGTPKARKQNEGTETSSSLKKRLSLLISPAKRMSPARAVPSPSPQKLPDALRIEEVLARVQFEDVSKEVVERVDFGVLGSEVQRSCVGSAAIGNLRYGINEVTSWCSGLADSIPALEREKVSRVFSIEDPTTLSQIDESIQTLQTIENVHVRSGYCHWRSKLEKTICDGLVQSENKLLNDLKTLRSLLDNDRSYRESELRAVKELLERERQMEQLLDGIEEQQDVQRQFESSVLRLESECSSLSLEASVLDQQLVAVELSTPQSDLSEELETNLRKQVLELEELLAVRENVGMWRLLSATESKLAIASRFEDVFFSIEVRVSIDVTRQNGRASLEVSPVFTNKTRRSKVVEESQFDDEDALSTIAATILSKSELESFESTTLDVNQLSTQLVALTTQLRRAYQYLTDLRSVSTQFGMRLESGGKGAQYLWIDFVRFPHVIPTGTTVDGVKFSVGHRLTWSWPFTDFEWRTHVFYGKTTDEKLQQYLTQVSTQSGHDYLMRICQRLRDVFIKDS